MKGLLNLFRRVIRKNFLSLLLFEIWYRVTVVLIAIPLLYYIFDWSMDYMGYSYITPKNIADYVRNPFVIITLLILVLLAALLNLFEINTLFAGFRYAYHGISIKMAEMILLGWYQTKALLKRYKGWVLTASILLFLFVKLHVIVIWMRCVPAASYLVELLCIGVGSKCLLVLLAVIFLMFGIAGVALISECTLAKREWKQIRGQMFPLLIKYSKSAGPYLLALHGLIWGMLVLIYVLLMCLSILILLAVIPEDAILPRVLHVSIQLLYLVGICAGIFSMVLNMGLIFSLYSWHSFREEKRDVLQESFLNLRADLTQKARLITLRMIIVVIVIESVLLVQMLQASSVRVIDVTTITAVTAHRGGAAYAPENTLAALKKSIDYGVDYAEIDVQMSLDGTVVLFHDTNARRIAGVKKNICDMTYEELQQLDVGKYFRPEFEGERIPTLEEVLQYCKGKINLNIEIKENRRFEEIVDQVVALIEENNFTGQCVVTSMSYDYLKQVEELDPDIRTGYILKMAVGDLEKMEDVDFFSMKYSYVTEDMVNAIHKAGKEVHVWTVNSRNAVKRMRAIYVDNIITDDPTLVRQTLAEENHQATVAELFSMLWEQ